MTKEKSIECSLLDRTRELFYTRSIQLTFEKLEEETGISKHWFATTFQNSEDPSVRNVQKLYEYLSKSKLTLN